MRQVQAECAAEDPDRPDQGQLHPAGGPEVLRLDRRNQAVGVEQSRDEQGEEDYPDRPTGRMVWRPRGLFDGAGVLEILAGIVLGVDGGHGQNLK
jgi:hypothetical protein